MAHLFLIQAKQYIILFIFKFQNLDNLNKIEEMTSEIEELLKPLRLAVAEQVT